MYRIYSHVLHSATAALFLTFCILVLPVSAPAQGTLRVVYDLPEPEDLAAARIIYRSELAEEVAQIVEDWKLLKKDVTLRFGAVIGPHFTVLRNNSLEIQIPYAFLSDMLALFNKRKSIDQEPPTTSALNALHHVIYHEIGHAIIYTQQTGISESQEEDAVDNLSAILLISAYEDGAEIAASAAKALQLLATQPESATQKKNDIRRVKEINCLIYGSNPDKYQALLNDLPANSMTFCPIKFSTHHKLWEKVFNIPLPD